MDEFTADAFSNRDEPVPLLTVTHDDEQESSSEVESGSRRSKLKRKLSASRLKEKADPETAAGLSLQDRLFAKLLQQVTPTEEADDGADVPVDRRSSKYVKRPAFSLPLMTNNFRRFNARVGIVFVFQNRLIRLFTWRVPTHTLSFLSVYTFVCLDPYLLVILPLATVLLFIMIPAFLTRHPPPPPSASTSATIPYYSYSGPALAPPPTIKPASETSKDFFRNMRDLQNSMSDFATLHDTTISLVAPSTNFSNEAISSAVFLYLAIITALLFIVAPIVPWRLVLLLGGYAATICGHPRAQAWLEKVQRRAKEKAEAANREHKKASTTNTEAPPLRIPYLKLPLPIPTSTLALKSSLSCFSAITLDTAPETREVEIFELQHRPLSLTIKAGEWQPHLFTPNPYDPLSPARISGDRPHGTRFFEDVQPPRGWAWEGKKWELDLEPREWVAERLVTGVEFADVEGASTTVNGKGSEMEEFGGWVWDLPPKLGTGGIHEEMWLGDGDSYDTSSKKAKSRDYAKQAQVGRDWEEGRWAGKTGEWRRRRWVRLVKRIAVDAEQKARHGSRASISKAK